VSDPKRRPVGTTSAANLLSKIRDDSGHEHGADGKFTSGSGGGGAASSSSSSSVEAAHAKLAEVGARYRQASKDIKAYGWRPKPAVMEHVRARFAEVEREYLQAHKDLEAAKAAHKSGASARSIPGAVRPPNAPDKKDGNRSDMHARSLIQAFEEASPEKIEHALNHIAYLNSKTSSEASRRYVHPETRAKFAVTAERIAERLGLPEPPAIDKKGNVSSGGVAVGSIKSEATGGKLGTTPQYFAISNDGERGPAFRARWQAALYLTLTHDEKADVEKRLTTAADLLTKIKDDNGAEHASDGRFTGPGGGGAGKSDIPTAPPSKSFVVRFRDKKTGKPDGGTCGHAHKTESAAKRCEKTWSTSKDKHEDVEPYVQDMSLHDPGKKTGDARLVTEADLRNAIAKPHPEQDATDAQLKGWVAVLAQMGRQNGVAPEHNDYQHMLDGEHYKPQPLPKGFKRGKERMCFMNAYRLAASRGDLHYVEGYASHLIPTHHAWVVDDDGNVIDPTWPDVEPGEKRSYLGTKIPMPALMAQMMRFGTYGYYLKGAPPKKKPD